MINLDRVVTSLHFCFRVKNNETGFVSTVVSCCDNVVEIITSRSVLPSSEYIGMIYI